MWSDEAWYCIGSVSCTSCNANAYLHVGTLRTFQRNPEKLLTLTVRRTCLLDHGNMAFILGVILVLYHHLGTREDGGASKS